MQALAVNAEGAGQIFVTAGCGGRAGRHSSMNIHGCDDHGRFVAAVWYEECVPREPIR